MPTGNSHLCPLGYDYTFAMRIILLLMDGDGDGTISLEEFQAAHARIFKAMDADKDGNAHLGGDEELLCGEPEKGLPSARLGRS